MAFDDLSGDVGNESLLLDLREEREYKSVVEGCTEKRINALPCRSQIDNPMLLHN